MNLLKILGVGLVAAAAFGAGSTLSTTANAGVIDITYDLTSGTLGRILPRDNEHQIEHPTDLKDVTLEITAYDFTSSGGTIDTTDPALITVNAFGMGVFSDEDSPGTDGRLDGLDLNDMLGFKFFRDGAALNVQLIEMVFQTFDSPARLRLFIDEGNIAIATLFGGSNIIQQIGTGSNPFSLDFSSFSLFGDNFFVGTQTDASQYRIVSLTVRVVSEPGALALFGFGLLGFCAMRRRRAA